MHISVGAWVSRRYRMRVVDGIIYSQLGGSRSQWICREVEECLFTLWLGSDHLKIIQSKDLIFITRILAVQVFIESIQARRDADPIHQVPSLQATSSF